MVGSGAHKAGVRAGNAQYTAKHGWDARVAKLKAQFLQELVSAGVISNVAQAQGIVIQDPRANMKAASCIKTKEGIKTKTSKGIGTKGIKTKTSKGIETKSIKAKTSKGMETKGIETETSKTKDDHQELQEQIKHLFQQLDAKSTELAAAEAAISEQTQRMMLVEKDRDSLRRQLLNLENSRDILSTYLRTGLGKHLLQSSSAQHP